MKDYPFTPHFIEYSGYFMHYLDEGPAHGPAFLFLHGVPSWSYIYRRFIPPLAQAGFRVICPDMIGFGKSQKILRKEHIAYELYLESISTLIDFLQPNHLLVYGQDWGACLALHLAVEKPDVIQGVAVSNGTILTGEEKLPAALKLWTWFARNSPILPLGWLVNKGCQRVLSREERIAYDLPFRSTDEKVCIRTFPGWIPKSATQKEALRGQEIWSKLKKYEKPLVCLSSDKDPFTSGYEHKLITEIPGAKNQPHRKLVAGHFIQEDKADEIANFLLQFHNLNLTKN